MLSTNRVFLLQRPFCWLKAAVDTVTRPSAAASSAAADAVLDTPHTAGASSPFDETLIMAQFRWDDARHRTRNRKRFSIQCRCGSRLVLASMSLFAHRIKIWHINTVTGESCDSEQ